MTISGTPPTSTSYAHVTGRTKARKQHAKVLTAKWFETRRASIYSLNSSAVAETERDLYTKAARNRKQHAKVVAQVKNPDAATLREAASKGQLNLFRARSNAGTPINQSIAHAPTSNTNTPIHYAAAAGQDSFIRKLVEHGADLRSLDQLDAIVTPMGWAVRNNQLSTIRTLDQLGEYFTHNPYFSRQLWTSMFGAVKPGTNHRIDERSRFELGITLLENGARFDKQNEELVSLFKRGLRRMVLEGRSQEMGALLERISLDQLPNSVTSEIKDLARNMGTPDGDERIRKFHEQACKYLADSKTPPTLTKIKTTLERINDANAKNLVKTGQPEKLRQFLETTSADHMTLYWLHDLLNAGSTEKTQFVQQASQETGAHPEKIQEALDILIDADKFPASFHKAVKTYFDSKGNLKNPSKPH